MKEELVEISHQVVACGQSDEENQLTEQKGDVNVESNAHVVFLMITEKYLHIKISLLPWDRIGENSTIEITDMM